MKILPRKEGTTSTALFDDSLEKTGFSTDSNELMYMYLVRNVIKPSFTRLAPSFLLLFESQTKDSTRKRWFVLERPHKLIYYKSLKS